MKKTLFHYCVAGLAIALSFLVSSTPRVIPAPGVPEEREDHAWEMFEWWYSQRALPFDMIPQGAYQKAFLYAKTTMKRENRSSYSGFSGTATPPWVSIGPNNVGGRTLSIAVDPVNTNIVWAGSASGGLWKSTTGGEGASAWSYISTGYPTLAVSAIAIDPTNPNAMYIGTGEISLYHRPQVGTPGARSSYGMGILKSTDGGLTWNQTSLTWTFQLITAVQKVAINPLHTNTLYAATSEGVFKSTDAGTDWFVSDTTLMAMDVAINPADTTMIYASHGNLNSSPNPGLYKSSDAGGHWIQLTNGLPSPNFGRAVIAIAPTHPSTVYLGVANASSGAAFGLYRSDDNGGSWTQTSTTNFTGSQGWYDIAVAVKPDDQFTVFSSGLDIYQSASGGTSPAQKTFWYQGSMGPVPPGGPEGPSTYAHADHHAIVFDPVHPATVYFGTDGGVFKSTDGGNTYFGCNGGLVTSQFYNGFANAIADSSVALGGLQDNGVLKYEGSTTWNKVDGGDGGWNAIDPTNQNILYDEYVYLAIKKSVNNSGFSGITGGLPTGSSVSNFIAPFVISPSDPNVLYAGNKDVYKTTSGGNSWFAPNGGADLNGTKVACIGVSYSNSDTLLAGTGTGTLSDSPLFQVFASANGGQSWTNVTGSLPNRYPTDIEFDPVNSSTVYITYSGYGTPHVFKSTNLGQVWTNLTANLPDIPHQSIAVDPAFTQNIYVGTDLGVYHSSDGGASWEDFSDGMVPAMILDLAVSRSNNTLRAATFGSGVYQRKLPRIASLVLVAPNGGEVLLAGQPELISWSQQLLSLVRIDYSTDAGGTWNLVADSVPASAGQYSWSVPSISTTHARVRISDGVSGAPADSSASSFSIILTADVLDGWNLSSLRLNPPDPLKSVIFPAAISPAFTYVSGYRVRDSLVPGIGFWIKFDGPQLTPYSGDSVTTDTITVTPGWNLIGSLSGAVPVGSIVQLPPGIVGSPYFGYNGGYTLSSTLEPGKGYWVRAHSGGQLALRAGSTAGPPVTEPVTMIEKQSSSWTALKISDAAGRQQTLYLGLGSGSDRTGLDAYTLPPRPPEGGFDARFSTGRFVEFAEPGRQKSCALSISTPAYPVRISWDAAGALDGAVLLIDDQSLEMAGSGRAVIRNPGSRVIVRIGNAGPVPVGYALGQNYPNPFNPATALPFALSQRSVVTLKVYDVTGRVVATLLDHRLLDAGSHRQGFDAGALASGVYLYRLIAEPTATGGEIVGQKFESVRKMVLVR